MGRTERRTAIPVQGGAPDDGPGPAAPGTPVAPDGPAAPPRSGRGGKRRRAGLRSAGDVLMAHLRGEAEVFVSLAPRLRAEEDDAAHRMRVAARRMRSALRTCAPLLLPGPAADLSDDLRWAADALAGERDSEVLLERLGAGLAALPPRPGSQRARAAVERRLRTGLSRGHAAALRALASDDFDRLTARLTSDDLGLRPAAASARPADEAVPPLVERTLRRLERGVAGLDTAAAAVAYTRPAPLSGEDDEAWHRVRIQAKRARYAADMCVPAFGAPAKALATALRDVTETLGTHQDAALAADVARELGAGPRIGAPAAFVLGELYALQRGDVAAARYAFTTVWPAVRAARWPA